MEIQMMRVKGCRVMKRMANKQFKMLCKDYNKIYKIIDTLKMMIETGTYTKGTIDEIPTAIQAVQTLMIHSSLVSEDLEKTIFEIEKRLQQANEFKEQYVVSPLFVVRLDSMSNLVIYLREMKKEVDLIDKELTTILNKITDIEELEIL